MRRMLEKFSEFQNSSQWLCCFRRQTKVFFLLFCCCLTLDRRHFNEVQWICSIYLVLFEQSIYHSSQTNTIHLIEHPKWNWEIGLCMRSCVCMWARSLCWIEIDQLQTDRLRHRTILLISLASLETISLFLLLSFAKAMNLRCLIELTRHDFSNVCLNVTFTFSPIPKIPPHSELTRSKTMKNISRKVLRTPRSEYSLFINCEGERKRWLLFTFHFIF